MKKCKKMIGLLILVLYTTAVMLGCSVNEKVSLLNALEKTAAIRSSENQSVINMSFDISGLSAENQAIADQIEPMFRNIKIQSHQKLNQNTEKTRMDSELDMDISSELFSEKTSIWSMVDATGDTAQVRQIVKLPSVMSSQLPPALANKPYMVINQADMPTIPQLNVNDYKNITESINNVQSRLINFLREYAVKYDPQFAYVTYKGVSEINNIPVNIYEISLNNESLKSLVRYALYDISDNENTKNSLKELLFSIIALSGGMEAGQDLDLALDKLRDGSSNFRQDVDKFREAFRSVNILGEKGITLNLAIDNDGFIINQSGVIDLVFDTYAIDNAMEKLYAGEGTLLDNASAGLNMVMKSTISFDSYLYNINQDIKVDYPELSSSNSFNFTELSGALPSMDTLSGSAIKNKVLAKLDNTKAAMDVKKIKVVKTELSPLKINGTLMVPLKPVCKAIGAKVTAENGSYIVTKGDIRLVLKKNSNEATINGESLIADLPAVAYENDILIPAWLISENLNCSISAKNLSNTVTIEY